MNRKAGHLLRGILAEPRRPAFLPAQVKVESVVTEHSAPRTVLIPENVTGARVSSQSVPRIASSYFLSTLFLFIPVMALQADPLDHWHDRGPVAQEDRLVRVAFGQDRFVAVGQFGEIQISVDGVNWTRKNAHTAASLNQILSSGALFVAVGEEGIILTSMDGESWDRRESGTTDPLVALAYGNGRFLALGRHPVTNEPPQSTVTISVDGTNWVAFSLAMGGDPSDLVFGGGKFVATLWVDYGHRALATSIDGSSWAARDSPADYFPDRLTYGNGQFVAVGGYCGLGGCSGSIMTSPNGVSWTPAPYQRRFLHDIAFGGGQFVAVGGNCDLGGCSNLIVTSSDGGNWTPRNADTRATLTSVAFGNDTFVVLGENGLILQSDPLTDTSPVIAREPLGQTVQIGSTATLSVVSLGTSPFTYQWTRGGEPLPGATNATLTLTNVQLHDSGNYLVEVNNAFGNAFSHPAALGVEPLGPLGYWHWRNPTPQGDPLSCVAFVRDIFLAGGQGGGVLTSPNAVSWTLEHDDSIPGLLGVAYGNGLFVGVTTSGGTTVSSDGINWNGQDPGNGAGLRKIVFANGLFVTVGGQDFFPAGSQSSIMTSPNGVEWTPRDAGTTNVLLDVTYGQDLFLAVGAHGTVTTSGDGLTWTARDAGTNTTLEGVTYGDHLFVAVGTGFGDEAYFYDPGVTITSPDGIHWSPAVFSSGHLYAVAFGNGVYVATGGSCARYGCSQVLASSNDGLHWTQRYLDPEPFWQWLHPFRALAFGQGTFVAVNGNSTILTSVDGVRWQRRNAGVRAGLQAIACSEKDMVAVGGYYYPYGSSALVLSSTNGVNWTEHAPAIGMELKGAAFGNGIFVVAGYDTLFTSTNAADWAPHTIPGHPQLETVCYAASQFILAGYFYDTGGSYHSSIWTSADGANWAEQYTWTNATITSVAGGNGRLVAVGSSGVFSVIFQARMLTSSDGFVWTPLTVEAPGLFAVVFGNGQFVATGGDCDRGGCTRVILTSSDGLTWTLHSSRYDPILRRLAYGQGHFTALGDDGNVHFSIDGVHWINSRAGPASRLSGVGFGQGTFLVVGDNGAILQSDPLSVTPPGIAVSPASQVLPAGAVTSFGVTASGTSPLSYQWLKNGTAISGATNATLPFRQVNLDDDGDYFVVVSNPAGAAVTQPVQLTVHAVPEAGELGLDLDPFVELTLSGQVGRTYELQAADNLHAPNTWRTLTRIQLPAVPFTWTDAASPPASQRFYRAVLLP